MSDKPSVPSLLLGADRASWAASVDHGSELDRSSKMKAVRDEILRRDDHTCQHCGWRSERWQEIHHKDSNHRNFDKSNLEVICPMCHQVFHLSTAAATGGGSIVWLPEVPQAVLHHLCIALFVALRNDNSRWAGSARGLFGAFEARKSFVEQNLANGGSDPGVLAQTLLKMSPEDYARRHEFLAPLRLLPYASRFQAQIDYWASAQFREMPLESWTGTLPEGYNVVDIIRAIEQPGARR